MTLNGVMAVTLSYFTEFGKPPFQHITASICGVICARVYYVFVVAVRYRRKKSSRSLYLISWWVSCFSTLSQAALCTV